MVEDEEACKFTTGQSVPVLILKEMRYPQVLV
jgi:hypothetical protein